jgi:MoaA/NifB/PqqE/SkfB family radical SAM enzyme
MLKRILPSWLTRRLKPKEIQPPVDTFCIYPWIHLQTLSNGVAHVCCKFRGTIESAGSPMSIGDHSLDAIWNSEYMRTIRRDMVEGRRVAGCQECYDEEKTGGFSMRKRDTEGWSRGWLNEEGVTLPKLTADCKKNDYYLSTLPVSYEIDVGNFCNLACRMCYGGSSSRIDNDPIHRRWSPSYGHDPEDAALVPPHPTGSWLTRTAFTRNEILQNAGRVKRLHFLGGETLIIKEVAEILQHLVDMGVSHNIEISLVTNGTTTKSQCLALSQHFKNVGIAISIDGFGPYYEYIRYPGKWSTIVENINSFRKLPRISLGAAVTLQLYNALNIVELFRYLDSIDLGFYAYPIAFPKHLSVAALPPRARAIAAERLRQYAMTDCKQENRDMILGLAQGTQSTSTACDMSLLRNLMLFTNDLDLSRGQSFANTHAELLQLIRETGFEWTEEVRFVSRAQ